MKPKMKEKKLYFFTSNNKISLEEVELSWIKKSSKVRKYEIVHGFTQTWSSCVTLL
jgi:hypothetical protein